MQALGSVSRCPALERAAQPTQSRQCSRVVAVRAAAGRDEKQMRLAAAAGAAALLMASAQPALADVRLDGATLFESGSQTEQELQDIIAQRGKALQALSDVPEAVQAAAGKAEEALVDKPLEKIQGTVKKVQAEVPDNVPTPLAPPKEAAEPYKPAPTPTPAASAPTAAAPGAAPVAPELPGTPAAPADGPSPTVLLGGAVVVLGGAALAASGNKGQLEQGAEQAADAAKGAADKAASAAGSAADKAPQSAEEAQEQAKKSAAEAREWINNWRNKQ